MEIITDLKCLLCLTNDSALTKIFSDDGKKLNVASLLKLHFWFELKEDDIVTNNDYVCSTCWKHIDDFHGFYMKISDIHHSSYWSIKDEILLTPIIKEESEHNAENDFLNSSSAFNDEVKIEERPDNDNIDSFMFNDNGDDINITDKKKENSEEESEYENDDTAIASDDEDEECEEIKEEDIDDEEDEDEKPVKRKRRGGRTKSEKNSKPKKFDAEKIRQEDLLIGDFFKMVCEQCPKVFEKFQHVRSHYRVEHKTRGYLTCCDRKFHKRCLALEHAQRHTDPESFRCPICQKMFANKKGLIVHIESHEPTQEKPFICTKCPKAFAKKFQLYQHQIQHIPTQEKKFSCEECGKAFAKNSILQSHIRIVHAGAHVHVCEICAKSYKSKMFFERHYKIVHCNIIPPKLQCQLCGVWLKEDSLRKHMLSHEDEGKVHICTICGKQSPNSRALQSHTKFAHLAERTHKCSVCDKAFKRALALKEHMTLHTGEVLYTCPHCPRTFNSGANMHSHRKKVHPKEWEENRRNKLSNM